MPAGPTIHGRSTRAPALVVATALLALAAGPPAATADEPAGAVAAASPTAGASAVSTKGWRTLRGKNGFRIKAPKGYRLRVRRGAYEIVGKRAELGLIGVRTTDSVKSVAEGYLGVTPPGSDSAKRLAFQVPLKGGKQARVFFEKAPKGVSVLTVTPRGSRKTVSTSERRKLARIAGTARRIKLTKLKTRTTQIQEAPLALKAFTNADGTAKADVPDGDGWVASGQQGVVEGGKQGLAGFAFGVNVPFFTPSAFCFGPCPGTVLPFMGSAAAVAQAWPAFVNSAGGQLSNVQVVSTVPGSVGVLGPGIDSGMYQFTGVSGGTPVVGYIIAGTFQVSPDTWYLYYSYVATAQGAPGAVGEALMATWRSWDPSADQARRQRLTFIAQQETLAIIQQTTEYQRRVYDKTNYNWLQLIRGENPVLAPVDPSVIGENGETLVRDTEGNLFDLEGNQFSEPGS